VSEQVQETVDVAIETVYGTIVVRLNPAAAPATTANFLHYVDGGLYDGGRFHRTVRTDNNANANLKGERIGSGIDPNADRRQMPNDQIVIEVIQGGTNPDRSGERQPPIPLERTRDTGLRHLDGTISMARFTPDSAVSDFFICINDQPDLDFGGLRNPDGQGFAAFGQVIEGMDVVRAIQGAPSAGQVLEPPVEIARAWRVSPE
jgi:peptidyl-prolyl cis-trans isomerase A (cyclophilin A)